MTISQTLYSNITTTTHFSYPNRSKDNLIGTIHLTGSTSNTQSEYSSNIEHDHDHSHFVQSKLKKTAIFLSHLTGLTALIYPIKQKIFSGHDHEHGDANQRTYINDFDETIHQSSLAAGTAPHPHTGDGWLDLSRSISIHGDLSSLGSFMPIFAFILPFAYLGTKSGVEGIISANQEIKDNKKTMCSVEIFSQALGKALEHLDETINKETNHENKQQLKSLRNILIANKSMLSHKIKELDEELKRHKLDKKFGIFAMWAGSLLSQNFLLQFGTKMASITQNSTSFLNAAAGLSLTSGALSFFAAGSACVMATYSAVKSFFQLKEAKADDKRIKHRFEDFNVRSLTHNTSNSQNSNCNYRLQAMSDYQNIINKKNDFLINFFKIYLGCNSTFAVSAGLITGFLGAKLGLTIAGLAGGIGLSALSHGAIPVALVSAIGAIGAVAYLTGHVIQHKKQKQKQDIKHDDLFQYHQFLYLLNQHMQPKLRQELNILNDEINSIDEKINKVQNEIKDTDSNINKSSAFNEIQPLLKLKRKLKYLEEEKGDKLEEKTNKQIEIDNYEELSHSITLNHSLRLMPSKNLFEGVRSLSAEIAEKSGEKYKQTLYSHEKKINLFTSIKETTANSLGILSRTCFKGIYSLSNNKFKKHNVDKKNWAVNMHHKIFKPNTLSNYDIKNKLEYDTNTYNSIPQPHMYKNKIHDLIKTYLLQQQEMLKQKQQQTQTLRQVFPLMQQSDIQHNSKHDLVLPNNVDIKDRHIYEGSLQNLLAKASIKNEENDFLNMKFDEMQPLEIIQYFADYKKLSYKNNISEVDDQDNLYSSVYSYLTSGLQKEYEHNRNYLYNIERAI